MNQLRLWDDAPAPARPVGPFICSCCGATSPNEFLAELNHRIDRRGVCVSVWLRASQQMARERRSA